MKTEHAIKFLIILAVVAVLANPVKQAWQKYINKKVAAAYSFHGKYIPEITVDTSRTATAIEIEIRSGEILDSGYENVIMGGAAMSSMK